MVKVVFLFINVAVLALLSLCLMILMAHSNYTVSPAYIYRENISYPDLLRISSSNLTEPSWQLSKVRSGICNGSATFIITVVPSAVQNFDRRMRIRETWSSDKIAPETGLRTVFILGGTLNSTVQKRVEEEAERYEDIIQTSFIDTYRNLTYKTISALQWVSEKCNDVPWIAKIDDDVLVNPFNLRRFLLHQYKLHNNTAPAAIFGRLRKRSRPMSTGKWNVTEKEYPYRFYPPFVLGSAYIIGRSAVGSLIVRARSTPFLWLEDVFVTGLVAEAAKINRVTIEKDYFVNRVSTKLLKGNAIFLVNPSIKIYKYAWGRVLYYKMINGTKS